MVTTILAFIIVFGSLVFFHELGHFIFAKRAGILVREFAIGFGPKLFHAQKGETLYTIRLLPLGGYVRMAGEDFDSIELQPGYRVGLRTNENGEAIKLYLAETLDDPDVFYIQVERADLKHDMYIEGYDEEEVWHRIEVSKEAMVVEQGETLRIAPYERQFESKSLGHRTMTIFAGPLFNFILAFFLFVAIGFIAGVPTNEPIIADVQEQSAAKDGGLQSGDYIVSVDGEPVEKWTAFADYVRKHPEVELNLIVEREGKEIPLTVIPTKLEEAGQAYGQVGAWAALTLEKGIWKSFVYGGEQTVYWFKKIFEILGQLVTGQFTIDALTGPVGIYKATEEVAKYGVINIMNFAAILSINLGIMNLLPLPALDGGRLFFFGIEAVRGRPVSREKEGMVHFIGIVLLLVLMVVVTWNDIQRFFF